MYSCTFELKLKFNVYISFNIEKCYVGIDGSSECYSVFINHSLKIDEFIVCNNQQNYYFGIEKLTWIQVQIQMN